ncbi:MAG: hypothetical protein WAY65_04020, partial [Lactococcus chungangensis]
MNGKSFLRNLSRKTKITIATVIVLAGGSMGTAATISNHQEQVKTAKSALYQQIDDLSDFKSSEFLSLTYTKIIDAQVEKYEKKANCKSKLATQINLYRRAVIKHFSWIVIHPNFNLSDLFRGR